MMCLESRNRIDRMLLRKRFVYIHVSSCVVKFKTVHHMHTHMCINYTDGNMTRCALCVHIAN